jgi:Zn-finger nucleic acid-binding protein
MNCPVCNVELLMTDRQGVEIDYCPKCRGVWLDRGELDKLIERASHVESQYNTGRNGPNHYDDDDLPNTVKRKNDERYYDKNHPQRRHKKSFLEDMFDLFD